MAGPTLKAKATLDDNPFKRKLRGMVSAAAAAGKKMGASLKKVGSAVGVGGGVVAGAVATAGTAFTRNTIKQGSALFRLSKQTGIAVRDLDILGDTFEENGADLNTLGSALVKMNKNLIAAANGGTPLAMMLQETGTSVKDFITLQPAERFQGLAKAIIGLENPLQRAAMAEAAFGKVGQDLIPVLYGVAEVDFKKLDKGAEAMDKAAGTANELKKSLSQAADAIGNFGIGLMTGFAPQIQAVASAISSMNTVELGQDISGAITGNGGQKLDPMVSVAPKDPFANFATAHQNRGDSFYKNMEASMIGNKYRPLGSSLGGTGLSRATGNPLAAGASSSRRGGAALRREAADRQFQITGKRPGSSPGAYGAVRRGDAAMRSAIATEKERAGLGLPALNDKVGSILQILQSFE